MKLNDMILYLTAVQSSTSLRCDWLSRKALERRWKKVILDIFFLATKVFVQNSGREKRERERERSQRERMENENASQENRNVF